MTGMISRTPRNRSRSTRIFLPTLNICRTLLHARFIPRPAVLHGARTFNPIQPALADLLIIGTPRRRLLYNRYSMNALPSPSLLKNCIKPHSVRMNSTAAASIFCRVQNSFRFHFKLILQIYEPARTPGSSPGVAPGFRATPPRPVFRGATGLWWGKALPVVADVPHRTFPSQFPVAITLAVFPASGQATRIIFFQGLKPSSLG